MLSIPREQETTQADYRVHRDRSHSQVAVRDSPLPASQLPLGLVHKERAYTYLYREACNHYPPNSYQKKEKWLRVRCPTQPASREMPQDLSFQVQREAEVARPLTCTADRQVQHSEISLASLSVVFLTWSSQAAWERGSSVSLAELFCKFLSLSHSSK